MYKCLTDNMDNSNRSLTMWAFNLHIYRCLQPFTRTPAYKRAPIPGSSTINVARRTAAIAITPEKSFENKVDGRRGSGPTKGLRAQLCVIVITFMVTLVAYRAADSASEGTQLITLADIWTFTMSCSRSNLLLHHKRCVRIGDGRIGQESVHRHRFECTPR